MIEINYGCDTCDRRDAAQFELLQEVRCELIEGLVCPDCGEEYDLFVEEG